MLIQVPHAALHILARESGVELPGAGEYGVGMCFLPTDDDLRLRIHRIVAEVVAEKGQSLLGWRDVATDGSRLGRGGAGAAAARQPGVHRPPAGAWTMTTPSSGACT